MSADRADDSIRVGMLAYALCTVRYPVVSKHLMTVSCMDPPGWHVGQSLVRGARHIVRTADPEANLTGSALAPAMRRYDDPWVPTGQRNATRSENPAHRLYRDEVGLTYPECEVNVRNIKRKKL